MFNPPVCFRQQNLITFINKVSKSACGNWNYNVTNSPSVSRQSRDF